MMEESRECKNCKKQFAIQSEDFDFYKKIDVPPPTWCPECRLQRRLSFYNLTNLFKRPCDLCKKDTISMYPVEASFTVYCPDCWWSDKWDPFDYGRDYDFSRPFLDQFRELWQAVPLQGLSVDAPSRSTSLYTNHVTALKNCYLLFQAGNDEECMYGFDLMFCKGMLDSSLAHSCERLYDCSSCYKNNNCIGLRGQVTESIDSAFLSYSSNCQNCFASRNLRNKKYYFLNKPYSKEEYQKLISQYNLGSWKTYQEVQRMAEEHWKTLSPNPDISERAINSTGRRIFDSKNCKECYETVGVNDSKFMTLIGTGPVSDCYDITSWGENLSLSYECMNTGINVYGAKFAFDTGMGVRNGEYITGGVGAASDIFGSVSLKNGQYVILNKRYSKEEYEVLRKRIIVHMDEMPFTDKGGRAYSYGEFFPSELSSFDYNLTLANLFFPLKKEEALEKGYAWRDPQPQEYVHTMEAKDLPDHIKEAPDTITKEVIACEECGRGYRILESELAQRHSMNVPLPRTCPFCRIEEKMRAWVKSLRMLDRTCAQCGKSFKTNFDEEEAPYILCKPCYIKEIV